MKIWSVWICQRNREVGQSLGHKIIFTLCFFFYWFVFRYLQFHCESDCYCIVCVLHNKNAHKGVETLCPYTSFQDPVVCRSSAPMCLCNPAPTVNSPSDDSRVLPMRGLWGWALAAPWRKTCAHAVRCVSVSDKHTVPAQRSENHWEGKKSHLKSTTNRGIHRGKGMHAWACVRRHSELVQRIKSGLLLLTPTLCSDWPALLHVSCDEIVFLLIHQTDNCHLFALHGAWTVSKSPEVSAHCLCAWITTAWTPACMSLFFTPFVQLSVCLSATGAHLSSFTSISLVQDGVCVWLLGNQITSVVPLVSAERWTGSGSPCRRRLQSWSDWPRCWSPENSWGKSVASVPKPRWPRVYWWSNCVICVTIVYLTKSCINL